MKGYPPFKLLDRQLLLKYKTKIKVAVLLTNEII